MIIAVIYSALCEHKFLIVTIIMQGIIPFIFFGTPKNSVPRHTIEIIPGSFYLHAHLNKKAT
jgi:hypothetical protein